MRAGVVLVKDQKTALSPLEGLYALIGEKALDT